MRIGPGRNLELPYLVKTFLEEGGEHVAVRVRVSLYYSAL